MNDRFQSMRTSGPGKSGLTHFYPIPPILKPEMDGRYGA
jgi:hypothetical protein